jgi:hypothetical protein
MIDEPTLKSELAELARVCGASAIEPQVHPDKATHSLVGVVHTGAEPGDYRWCLDVRFLAPEVAQRPILTVIQMNPSTASELKSDPTRGKVARWAFRHQYSGVRLLNMFGIRYKDPDRLMSRSYAEVVGPDADDWLRKGVADRSHLVLAWGGTKNFGSDLRERFDERMSEVLSRLDDTGVHYVGRLTEGGRYPLHGRCWNRDRLNVGGDMPEMNSWPREAWPTHTQHPGGSR